jgi:hypothetical protein
MAVTQEHKNCFFHTKSFASGNASYNGYLIKSSRVSSYNAMLGTSPVNFRTQDKRLSLPRSNKAKIIHIFTAFIKVFIIVAAFEFYNGDNMYWIIVGGFTCGIFFAFLFSALFSVKPRNFYLYNLSSALDILIIISIPLLTLFFFSEYAGFAYVVSLGLIFFVNSFTCKLRKYSFYKLPEDFEKAYSLGFIHGFHPALENFFGIILKPLRWIY